ncbi:SDR family oxidoreductase [Microvirga guangxiensis]|uniref:NAD(P)-dependent dehydrogenase, short-chain alcohol dehydrogenase family n=1 Tax=Microvirga guangxiensis TaxID=549386 RepID=A0A1G5HXG9_9HYPH|nr:SDR family oxidoreductase [Microvirga guangxiensis]SCY68427.1 NAD(P)-dependent dehydrogenase, short-chain alcohol dehydrogenase family [Microvirga guangxiensis]
MSTYLITGIGRGIGQELARALLMRGERVIGTLRDPAQVPASLSAFAESGQLKLLTLDVQDGASIAEAARQLDEPVDVLVNNAGIIGQRNASSLDTDAESFLETLRVNTLGPLRVIQAFLPHLRRSKAAKIMTISSRMGSMSHAKSDRIAYRASKAAVNKVMQGLATDLQPEGIAVFAVHPGWVRTDMGGSGADIAVEESAAGLIRLIDGLSLKETGGFFDWTGDRLSF